MEMSDWINLGIAAITLLGVITAVIALYVQIRKLNQQLMLQHFADYTKRYQEIILEFPENINQDDFHIEGDKSRDHTMRYMRAYFDLCFEEWYLNGRNLIDKEIWNVWIDGMRAALSKPAFQQAWVIIKNDSSFGEEFHSYITSLSSK